MNNNLNPGSRRKEKQMNVITQTTSVAVLLAQGLAPGCRSGGVAEAGNACHGALAAVFAEGHHRDDRPPSLHVEKLGHLQGFPVVVNDVDMRPDGVTIEYRYLYEATSEVDV